MIAAAGGQINRPQKIAAGKGRTKLLQRTAQRSNRGDTFAAGCGGWDCGWAKVLNLYWEWWATRTGGNTMDDAVWRTCQKSQEGSVLGTVAQNRPAAEGNGAEINLAPIGREEKRRRWESNPRWRICNPLP